MKHFYDHRLHDAPTIQHRRRISHILGMFLVLFEERFSETDSDYKIKERYCDTAVHTSLICFVKSILG